MHIVFHKTVRSLHEAIFHRLHGCFHVIAGIHGDKALHIIQRVGVALCTTFKLKGKLVALMEHLADLRLAHRCVNVGKLVVNRLHQPANGFIDPAADFFPVYADNITIYIDGCFFQCFGQVELGVLVALPHFHTLCLFDRLVLGKLCGSVFPKEAFDFQVGLDFRQELSIIGENDKDFSALTGHHPKCTIVRAAVIPRCQDTKADVIVLICFVWTIIYKLVEAKGIAAIEDRIGVAFAGENVLKNHLRDLGDDFRRFDIFLFDLVVDFLFLIGQEDIDAAVFLNQHLPHQDLQRFLHAAFQLNPVIIDIFNHQAGDVVDIRLNFQHILDHEEGLEDIDSEDILVLLLRVDVAVVISPDDHPAMAVIQKVFQCVIKAMEGYNDPCLFIHDVDSGLLEERQHGPLATGKVLAGSSVGTNGSQYAGQQIELIRYKGVDLGKVFGARIQLLFCRVIEYNQVLDNRCLLLIKQSERLRSRFRLFKDSLLDNGIHICRREGETGIKPTLNFGEVVALDLGDGVDVLLAGHDDPSFAHALLTKFLGNGLEIEHQLGIIADVLPDFIHQKYNMVVVPLALDIALDALGEVLDADGIRLHRLFAPVPCRCLAHEIHRDKGIHNAVLNEVKVLPGIFPRLAVLFLKSSLELVVSSFFGKPPFQISDMGNGTAEALHLIEDLEEYIDNGILVLFAVRFALGVDVEENHIGRGFSRQLHVGQYHRVYNLLILDKVIHRPSVADLTVFQKVRQDFQEVRFTASKEAGNPYAHLRRCPDDPFFVSRVEVSKVLLKFTGYNIFLELLRYIGIFALPDDNYALNFAVDFLGEHILYFHYATSITLQAGRLCNSYRL